MGYQQRSDAKVYRLVVMAMLIGLGVVISPILRVEGMCPMAHLINITCSVLLGPWYSFVCATLIGIIRMTTMGIPPLALTGAVFGAALSGILYRASGGKIWAAVVGEIIGTGIIGGFAAYPIAKYLMGLTPAAYTVYIVPFLISTVAGSILAGILVAALRKAGVPGLASRA